MEPHGPGQGLAMARRPHDAQTVQEMERRLERLGDGIEHARREAEAHGTLGAERLDEAAFIDAEDTYDATGRQRPGVDDEGG